MAWSVTPIERDVCRECGAKFCVEERARLCELSHQYDDEAQRADREGRR